MPVKPYGFTEAHTRPVPSVRTNPATVLTPARALAAQCTLDGKQQCPSASLSLARTLSVSRRSPACAHKPYLTAVCGHGAARAAVHRTVNQPLSCSAAPGAFAREPQQLRVVGDRLARLSGSAKGVLRGV